MSKPLLTVRPDHEPAAAWQLLRTQQLPLLLVTNDAGQLLGVVGVSDFLSHLPEQPARGWLRQLYKRVVPHYPRFQKRRVADIMRTQVNAVHEQDHIALLVPLLSDQKLPAVPVLNADQQVVGIISQAELIAGMLIPGAP